MPLLQNLIDKINAPMAPEPVQDYSGFLATVERISPNEFRTIFSLAASSTILDTSLENITTPIAPIIEVLEVVVQPSTANVITITINNVAITFALSLAANQLYSDPGFILQPPAQLGLTLGTAATVNGFIRWRHANLSVDSL